MFPLAALVAYPVISSFYFAVLSVHSLNRIQLTGSHEQIFIVFLSPTYPIWLGTK